MKYAFLLAICATPAFAQEFNIRASDTVPTRAALSETILDRNLEYFDGGISRYSTGGAYAWIYSEENGGTTHTGVHAMGDDGVVCITYDTGPERCDMFVMSADRLILLTDDGDRFPIRTIQ